MFGKSNIVPKLYRGNCRTQRNMFIIICSLDYVYEKIAIDCHLDVCFHGIMRPSYKFYFFHTALLVFALVNKYGPHSVTWFNRYSAMDK